MKIHNHARAASVVSTADTDLTPTPAPVTNVGKPYQKGAKWYRVDTNPFDGRLVLLAAGENDTSRDAADDDYSPTCPACRDETDHTMDYHRKVSVCRTVH